MTKTYQKTKIGEHDFHKPACSEYCKMASDYCPFIAQGINSVENIARWADLADQRVAELKAALQGQDGGGDTSASYTYTADFVGNGQRTSVRGRIAGMFSKPEDSSSGGEPPVPQTDTNEGQISFEIPAGRYTCWGDGSGFEYDLMSRNVIGDAGVAERVYDITNYGIEHEPLKFSEWNAWVEKFQYDYRFGRVSDFNAECVLFPNVDNPWMFTEYVFRGVGGDNASGKIAWSIPEEYVVEPPLYDSHTLELINGDLTVDDPQKDYDGKYNGIERAGYDGRSFVRRFRTVELWHELTRFTPEELGLTSEQQSNEDVMRLYKNSIEETEVDVNDAGVRLYCAKIPVQSVKWGEHGNIPPHTLDMTAPSDWLDPTASVTKIRATYVAHLGTPLYAHCDGVIYWDDKQAYIGPFKFESFSIENGFTPLVQFDNEGRKEWSYETSGEGEAVAMPAKLVRGEEKLLSPTEKVMGVAGKPNLCHGGCALCSGVDGVARCGYLSNLKSTDSAGITRANQYFVASECTNADTISNYECPNKVLQRRHPLIATYQVETMQKDQVSKNIGNAWAMGAMTMSMGVGGALIGGEMTSMMMSMEMDKMAQQYINLGKRKDADITYELKYEAVKGDKESPQLNKKEYKGFGRGVQIVPGTGKFAIDTEENVNVFQGGDTNVYDDIDTLSFHRFFRNVLHCATQEHCNFFASTDQSDGWSPGEKAGGHGKCRYYKSGENGEIGCPYVNAPKRAIEFCNTASRAYEILADYGQVYSQMTKWGCWEFIAGDVIYETIRRYRRVEETPGKTWVIFDNKWAVLQESDTVALVAIRVATLQAISAAADLEYSNVLRQDSTEELHRNKINEYLNTHWDINSSKEYGGMMLVADDDCPIGFMRICKFKTRMREVEMDSRPWYRRDGEPEMVLVKTYDVLDIFYWFKPLYNDGNGIFPPEKNVLPSLRQNVDSKGRWLCKVERSVVVPKGNCVMIDNDSKFIGGWHPEYKDYSKLGNEFMQDIVSEESREGQGMGDYVTGQEYTPIPQTVSKKGYWVDQSGVYITDERSIGTNNPIAGNDERESNSGSSPCISYKKSNTEIDGETGKQKQPKVVNGVVFANDPYKLIIEDYKPTGTDEIGRPTGGRPEFDDPDKDQKYHAPCRVKQTGLLPTMRHALHCPKCDYYIPIRYVGAADVCPWCGSEYVLITGDDGSGFGEERYAAEGKTWDDDNPDASVMKKFFKIYAIGNADVWAPPGTSLRTDAYFWRHQAQITNATKRQIYHRLGNCSVENGYSFDQMSKTSEITLGFPEGIGKFQQIADAEGDFNKRLSEGVSWNKGDKASQIVMFNRVMPRHMLPGLYDSGEDGLEDEGIIAPYSTSASDALKIISSDQMRVLRNAIEPMYAYVVQPDDEREFPKDYPIERASYDQREKIDQNIIYRGRRAVISPIVIGMTDDGRDSFQRYYSGDLVYGSVLEYFPSGYTWWYMKQLLGGRYTDHCGGHYHMDDTGLGAGHMDGGGGGEYTCGTRTVAKCAMSIYGALPLDKDIVKAYVIISPDGTDPSKDPIGRSWTGGPVMYCHYHALPQSHKGEYWGLDGDDGFVRHLHGTAGYPNDQYFDADGNFVNPHPGQIYYASDDIAYRDESAYRLWGMYSHRISDDRWSYYNNTFDNDIGSLGGMYDTGFYHHIGTPKKSIMSEDGSTVIGYGYDEKSFPDPAGFTVYNLANTDVKKKQKYHYIVLDENNDIVKVYPDSMVWKTETKAQIEKTIRRHTADIEFVVSDGTDEGTVSYDFKESDSTLYGKQMPEKAQPITGYFDMSWANTKGYVTGAYSVDEKAGNTWDHPVIFQDGGGGGGGYRGGNGETQTGTVTRAIDVTPIIKNLYEKRIARNFSCEAGTTYGEIRKWIFYLPVLEDIDKLDDDLQRVNNQSAYFDDTEDQNMHTLLSDYWSYPELDGNLNTVPTVTNNGEKYEMAKYSIEIHVSIKEFPITIGWTNRAYCIRTSDDSIEGKDADDFVGYFDAGTVLKNIYDVRDALQTMFPQCDCEIVSSNDVMVRSSSNDANYFIELLAVYSYPDKTNPDKTNISCYELLGLPMPSNNFSLNFGAGYFYYGDQDRIVDVTSYLPGCHPSRLLSNAPGTWKYELFSPSPQSFTVDLLRAPLLMKERGWRYSAGNSEEPSDGIKTYFYDKAFSENPIISMIHIKPSELLPCGFKVMSKMSDGDVWSVLIQVAYENGSFRELYPHYKEPPDSGEGGGDNPPDPDEDPLDFVFYLSPTLARFVKVECDSEYYMKYYQFEIDSYEGVSSENEVDTSGGYQMIINVENTEQFNGCQSFAGIALIGGKDESYQDEGDDTVYYERFKSLFDQAYREGVNNYIWGEGTFGGGNFIRIVASQVLPSHKEKDKNDKQYKDGNDAVTLNQVRLQFDRYYPLETDNPPDSIGQGGTGYIKLFLMKYRGGIEKFGVYGTPYKTEKGDNSEKDDKSGGMYLTLTGPPDECQCRLDVTQRFYYLPNAPTQIWRVSVGYSESGGIPMTEVPPGSYLDLKWFTKTVKVPYYDEVKKGRSFVEAQQIIGGTYIYDPRGPFLMLPTHDQNDVHWADFEKGVRETDSLWTRLPTWLNVVYWTGNGKSVTLPAMADGNGPSFMVEKNAINTILAPWAGKTGEVSCQMLNPSGQVVSGLELPFVCYNDTPSTLSIEDSSRSNEIQGTVHFNAGEFRKPAFNGKELVGTKIDSDKEFIELFGDHCERCFGKCTTEVTFTGVPLFLLTGHIDVQAPAVTKHEVSFGGQTYEYVERTGGIDQGMFVVRCAPITSGDGRMTKCYKKPTLLIYAKERDQYQAKSTEESSSSAEDVGVISSTVPTDDNNKDEIVIFKN